MYILSNAEDEAARERIRVELYAPPDGTGGRRRIGATRPTRPTEGQDDGTEPTAAEAPRQPPPPSAGPGGGMAAGQARALMAQLAAEDARFTRRR